MARMVGRLIKSLAALPVLATLVLLTLAARPTLAGEVAGVTLPDRLPGDTLVLNGMALRVYSVFAVRVYVAGLYLERRSDDGAAILDQPGRKRVTLHMLRDVSAAQARDAWRTDLASACAPPCALPAESVARFLGAVADVRAGDRIDLSFDGRSLAVTRNDAPSVAITDPALARAVLGSFIGDHAPARIRAGLLGDP